MNTEEMLQILQDTDYVHKSGSPEERRPLSLIRAMHFPRINRWIPGRSFYNTGAAG